MPLPTPNVDVDPNWISKRGKRQSCLTLDGPGYHVTILISPGDVKKLHAVRSTPWETKSLRIGEVAGRPAFWSCDKKRVSILIGHDDESWGVGIFVPLKTLKKIIDEIEDCPLEGDG